jgi:hypothetical protein
MVSPLTVGTGFGRHRRVHVIVQRNRLFVQENDWLAGS